MKIFLPVFVIFFFLAQLSFAQPPMPPQHTKYNSIAWERLNKDYNNPKVVLDKKLLADEDVKRELDAVDPQSVIKLSVLHAKDAGQRNTVYITTKDDRIAAYQKKFSAFSEAYKKYLDKNQQKDYTCFYIINSVPLQGGRSHIIETLDAIAAENITNVSIDVSDGVGDLRAMVSIKTK